MEPRDRKKHDSDDIKLEDYKPDLPVIDTSSLTDDESSTEDRDIKQEATKNHDNLPQQMDIFQGKDYYHLCDICKERMPNLLTVIQHRRSVHKVKPYNTSMVKNFDCEPDIHDPNFYCKPCEVHYSSRNTYRTHLRKAHFMVLKITSKRKKPQNTIVPDPDDPNHYCRACDYVYANKLKYKYHCRYAHGMTSIELGNQGYLPDGIVDTHCKLCDMRLASKTTYKSHLFAIHKLDWRQIHEEPRDMLPDISDPNFYCNACDRKLSSKYSFRNHLILVHSIHQSAPKKTSLEPDADDPNNYCRACQRTYRSKTRYRTHLRIIHQMNLPSLHGNNHNGNFPDPNDPHYYCSVCKKHWINRKRYRYHCKSAHFMELEHYGILNPNAIIDVNHPQSYCAQCQRFYSFKSAFKRHLRQVHNI